MNVVVIMGRLTKDPEIRGNETKVAKYTLAVPRRNREESDYIPCVAFGRTADFAQTWLKKGMKVVVHGRIQTGSYETEDGARRYTTDVVVENAEFCESKAKQKDDGFSRIPEADR